MAEMFGKAEWFGRGRGGSMHLFDAKRQISSAETPSSAADCLSRSGLRSRIKCRRASAITACFFGDGAVAEGEFHESMNLAALWQLPVLFICENNLYAMGTALATSSIEHRHRQKADAYGDETAKRLTGWMF
jgi:TPP-dependent pyruvate/acetoin dehydrogenase alpha subunit